MFCTNCGAEASKSICQKCGVKNNTYRNYCFWCGQELNVNASICTNCGEKVRQYAATRILSIVIVVLVFVPLLLVGLLGLIFEDYLLALSFIIPALVSGAVILLIPTFHKVIKKAKYKKESSRNSGKIKATVWTFLIVTGSLVLSLCTMVWLVDLHVKADLPRDNKESNSETATATDEQLIKIAKMLLQKELRNPASLVVNSAEVELSDVDTENTTLTYTVTLDYSAQNGFGGMNRETYVVLITYKPLEGTYYRGNSKLVID